MAITKIAFGKLVDGMLDEETLTIADNITPSSTSQQSSISAPATGGSTVARIVTDTSIYVTFGENPTATAANSLVVLANSELIIKCKMGHKVAVLEVPGGLL